MLIVFVRLRVSRGNDMLFSLRPEGIHEMYNVYAISPEGFCLALQCGDIALPYIYIYIWCCSNVVGIKFDTMAITANVITEVFHAL